MSFEIEAKNSKLRKVCNHICGNGSYSGGSAGADGRCDTVGAGAATVAKGIAEQANHFFG